MEQLKDGFYKIQKEKLLTVEGQLKILETELMNTNSNISEIGNKIEQAKKRIDELKNILDDDVSKELNNKQEEADKIATKIEENSDRLNKMNQENAIEEASKLIANQLAVFCGWYFLKRQLSVKSLLSISLDHVATASLFLAGS